VESLHEAADYGRVAGVFAVVFAELACVAVERPRLGDLDREELDDYVARTYLRKVVGEVGAYAIGGLAEVSGIILNLNGAVDVEGVAEDYLLGARVYAELAVFGNYEVELFEVVAAVYTQALEHIGVVFGDTALRCKFYNEFFSIM